MTFEQWLAAQGYTQDDNGKWRTPDGGILSDDSLEYMKNADYVQWQEANSSGAYGTEGVAPGDDLKFYSTADREVTINGESYTRVGEDSANSEAVPYLKELVDAHPEYKQFLYNDQYGWVVPTAIWSKMAEVSAANNGAGGLAGFLDNGGGVALLAAAFGAMALGQSAALAAESAASATTSAAATTEAAALPASYDSMLASAAGNTATDVTAGALGSNTVAADYFGQLYTDLAATGGLSVSPLQAAGAAASVAGAASGGGGDSGELAPTGAQLLGEQPPTYSQTPEEWAKSIGATLNPDGTINWDSVDQTDLLKSLGYIDSGAVDPGKLGISDALAKILGVPTGGTTSGSMDSVAKTALGRILDGTATADDWAKLLGTAGSTALGVLGANKQADAYKEATDKFFNLGAPYRDKLTASYGPGFDLLKSDPQFQNALDTSADTVLRRLSATSGNPFDNPGGMTEAMRYVTGNTYLPQLNTYRSQLGSFGGLGVNTAGTASIAGAQNSGGLYDALGYGLGSLTGTQSPYNQNTSLANLLRGSNLNLGSLF